MGYLEKSRCDGSWVYGYCDSCRKNLHEEVKMIKEKVSNEFESIEMWVCPSCGSTKRL